RRPRKRPYPPDTRAPLRPCLGPPSAPRRRSVIPKRGLARGRRPHEGTPPGAGLLRRLLARGLHARGDEGAAPAREGLGAARGGERRGLSERAGLRPAAGRARAEAP